MNLQYLKTGIIYLLFILFTSCGFHRPYNYINNAFNVPLVKQKGDIDGAFIPHLTILNYRLQQEF